MAYSKSTGNNKPVKALAPKAAPGSVGKKLSPLTTSHGRTQANASKVYSVPAPAKPKMASMKGAHGKLIPGNC